MTKKLPPPPARCLSQGACKYHAPACLETPQDIFYCDQSTGAWTSNYTHFPHDLTIAGPVLFLGNLTLGRNANITINETTDSVLYIRGNADFREANATIWIRVAEKQIEEYSKIEAAGSTDYSASQRTPIVAESLDLPDGFNLKLKPTHKCHVPYILDKKPALDSGYITKDPQNNTLTGDTFHVYFYTKSQCWWWVVLVGAILAYFAVLLIAIVAFRTIPTLKAWTTLPIFDTHMAAGGSRAKHHDKDEYELDNQPTASSRRSHSSDEGDSVALDI